MGQISFIVESTIKFTHGRPPPFIPPQVGGDPTGIKVYK